MTFGAVEAEQDCGWCRTAVGAGCRWGGEHIRSTCVEGATIAE